MRSAPALSIALEIPPWPLDVLAQQIVAAAACEEWTEDDLFELVRQRISLSRSAARRFRRSHRDAVRRHRNASAAAAARFCIAIGSTASCGAGAARGLRPSRPAAPFPKTPIILSSPNPKGRSSDTRRGLCSREPGRRRVPAGHHLVAHPPRGGRTRARGRCARRGAVDSLLARRGARPHGRAVRGSRAICATADQRSKQNAVDWLMQRMRAWTAAAPSRPSLYVRAGAAALGALPTQQHRRRGAVLR